MDLLVAINSLMITVNITLYIKCYKVIGCLTFTYIICFLAYTDPCNRNAHEKKKHGQVYSLNKVIIIYPLKS